MSEASENSPQSRSSGFALLGPSVFVVPSLRNFRENTKNSGIIEALNRTQVMSQK